MTNFSVPLTGDMHQQAQSAIASIPDPVKRKQIYLNLLATYAVDYYLKVMGFETALEQSDSQDPVFQHVLDIADLMVQNVGRLECRPVLEEETEIKLPSEVQEDRAAYVMVRLPDSLHEAEILGFAAEATPRINLKTLKPTEDLLDLLTDLEEAAIASQSTSISNKQESVLHRLTGWLENAQADVIDGWCQLQSHLDGSTRLAYQLLNAEEAIAAQRTKVFNLETALKQYALAVMITLKPEEDGRVKVLVQLQADQPQQILPEGAEIILLAPSGEQLMSEIARSSDQWIRLKPFRATVDEKFMLQIRLIEDGKSVATMTEAFVL